jgi:hypothetical protein
MSSLSSSERRVLEEFFGMSSGYVLNFSDRTFGDFVTDAVDLDIHDEKYATAGTSKAKKLRRFWEIEPDHIVGRLVLALIDRETSARAPVGTKAQHLTERCRQIATRLLAGGPRLDPIKAHAKILNADHFAQQIHRMESSVETDPALAIGTAKELIETCCKTILSERGKPVVGTPDIPTLTKETLKELKLVPDGIHGAERGADAIKRLLRSLGTIGNDLAELRGLYGTGHGQHGAAASLAPRHAKLAVGAAATLVMFLFETHRATKP